MSAVVEDFTMLKAVTLIVMRSARGSTFSERLATALEKVTGEHHRSDHKSRCSAYGFSKQFCELSDLVTHRNYSGMVRVVEATPEHFDPDRAVELFRHRLGEHVGCGYPVRPDKLATLGENLAIAGYALSRNNLRGCVERIGATKLFDDWIECVKAAKPLDEPEES